MVWDELTSVPDKFGDSFATEGVMGTFDEETRFSLNFFFSFSDWVCKFLTKKQLTNQTNKNKNFRKFFQNTPVSIHPLFRSGHMGIEELIFSHHQKTIICDDPLGGVTAYVGGLDLTRWVDGGSGGK